MARKQSGAKAFAKQVHEDAKSLVSTAPPVARVEALMLMATYAAAHRLMDGIQDEEVENSPTAISEWHQRNSLAVNAVQDAHEAIMQAFPRLEPEVSMCPYPDSEAVCCPAAPRMSES